jgi:hypothetical protein
VAAQASALALYEAVRGISREHLMLAVAPLGAMMFIAALLALVHLLGGTL